MPSEFRTLCCMAKVWRRDGTPLLKSSCSSYLCELMMLRAWEEDASRNPGKRDKRDKPKRMQRIFYHFLKLLSAISDASLVFTYFFHRALVPEDVLRQRPLVLSLSETTNNMAPKKTGLCAEIRTASEAEILRIDIFAEPKGEASDVEVE